MKEHIKNLELILLHPAYLDTADAAAIRAAIELMHAAEPLDAAAEREHCERAATHARNYGRDSTALVIEVDKAVELRAQARAAGYAQCLETKLAPLTLRLYEEQRQHTAQCAENRELTAQLSAAQVEIEILKQNLVHDGSTMRAENVDLDTKLTNLRVAAERYYNQHGRNRNRRVLRSNRGEPMNRNERTCEACDGRGQVKIESVAHREVVWTSRHKCPWCHGTGKLPVRQDEPSR